jgi:hypothetical protein
MASVSTNRGKYQILGNYFLSASGTAPVGFNLALITSAGVGTISSPVAPTASNCNTWSACSANEIPAGNGYSTGGVAIAQSSVGFPTFTEDDVNNRAFVGIQTISWTAQGGNLPISGSGAAYAVLMDQTPSKNVVAVLDLGGARTVSNTQSLQIVGAQYLLN